MAIRNLIKSVDLKFTSKKEISNGVYYFNFESDKPLSWKAGQYAVFIINPEDQNKSLKRSFSIASSPSEKKISIITRISKDEPDDFKTALMKLKKGEPISTRGPVGSMNIKDPDLKYAFFATGVGIASFRSILKELAAQGSSDTKITLFYVGGKDNHFFKDELSEFKQSLNNLSVEYIYKPERITGQLVENILGKELQETTFFLAGPPKIIKSYKRTLIGLGVPGKNITSSRYLDYRQRLALKLPLNNDQPVSTDV